MVPARSAVIVVGATMKSYLPACIAGRRPDHCAAVMFIFTPRRSPIILARSTLKPSTPPLKSGMACGAKVPSRATLYSVFFCATAPADIARKPTAPAAANRARETCIYEFSFEREDRARPAKQSLCQNQGLGRNSLTSGELRGGDRGDRLSHPPTRYPNTDSRANSHAENWAGTPARVPAIGRPRVLPARTAGACRPRSASCCPWSGCRRSMR